MEIPDIPHGPGTQVMGKPLLFPLVPSVAGLGRTWSQAHRI